MKKILVVFGTRPEAIKLAPVILQLLKDSSFRTIVAVTAQHREMLDQILNVFKIKPDYDLDIMTKNQTLANLTAVLTMKLDKLYEKVNPDFIIVQGDTTSAFLAALTAYYRHIPIGHIEAGLRSFDKFQPFPEEINRILISHTADYHFTPTNFSRNNLIREGIDKKRVYVTGNTIVDALQMIKSKIDKRLPDLMVKLHGKKIILLTAHRRENFGKPLMFICYAVKKLAQQHANFAFVYPVHLNPRVQEIVQSILKNQNNILLIPPLSYLDLVFLMKKSFLILTDSGGIQEEAPSLKKPILVLRNVTERPEGVHTGVANLVGTNKEKIVSTVNNLLTNKATYHSMISNSNPYGDGKASKRIISIIKEALNKPL